MTITNSGLIRFATANGIELYDGSGFAASLRMYSSTSGNRFLTIPNNSGTLCVGATGSLTLDPITGIMSITGGSAITSLGGLTAQTQTFSLAFTGSTPAIVSAVNDHQFRFQDAGPGMAHGFVTNSAQAFDGQKTMNQPFTAQAEKIGYIRSTNTAVSVTQQAAYFLCDPSVNGNMAMNLSNITSEPRAKYTFWRFTNGVGTNTVTIIPFGTEKIEGKTSIVLTQDFDYITIVNSGTAADGWKVIAGQVAGVPYGAKQLLPFTGYLRTTGDTVDISVPGMTTSGQIIGVTIHDGSITILPTSFNAFVYTDRFALRSSTHYSKDSVVVKGLYIK